LNKSSSTVSIVDDDQSVCKGLARLLRVSGFVVKTYDSATAFLKDAAPDGPSCVILDVHMPELTGLELQSELNRSGRDEQIIFITAHPAVPMSVQAMKGGAVDFLIKPFQEAELVAAIERALLRSSEQRRHRVTRNAARSRLDTLTYREFEVLQHVVAGLLNKQIADELNSAIGTIKVHRGRVMEKLGVTSVADLVRLVEVAGAYAPNKTKVV